MPIAQRNGGTSLSSPSPGPPKIGARAISGIVRRTPPPQDVVPPSWSGPAADARSQAIVAVLGPRAAKRAGIALASGELAWRVQLFRDRFELTSLGALQAALERAGLSFGALAGYLGGIALAEKLEEARLGSLGHGIAELARVLAVREVERLGLPLGGRAAVAEIERREAGAIEEAEALDRAVRSVARRRC